MEDELASSLADRTENFSASKAFICMGILFILFYPWGMEVYRRQPVLITKSKTSKPASDVYYHLIVQRSSLCPFMLYADYLSSVATQYPSLYFHVLFLEDDSLKLKRRCPRNAMLFDSYDHFPFTNFIGTNGFLEISDFERRYENVNVTVMTLSKYMEKIPLHHNWRNLPHSHLTFYARIFSVWQNGGVAMDLNYFNDNFNDLKRVTRRISAILKQHNDGIKVEEYTNALNKIDREEENEFFNIFYGLVHQILNETTSFFTTSFPFTQITTANDVSQNGPLVRANRNKRDVSTPINDKNNKSEAIPNVYVETMNSTKETATSSVVLFYNVFSNGIAPSEPEFRKSGNDGPFLSIESNGIFVAASSRLHPFLRNLVSFRCPHIHPKYAIQDLLLSQCSGLFEEDSYCNNIYLF